MPEGHPVMDCCLDLRADTEQALGGFNEKNGLGEGSKQQAQAGDGLEGKAGWFVTEVVQEVKAGTAIK